MYIGHMSSKVWRSMFNYFLNEHLLFLSYWELLSWCALPWWGERDLMSLHKMSSAYKYYILSDHILPLSFFYKQYIQVKAHEGQRIQWVWMSWHTHAIHYYLPQVNPVCICSKSLTLKAFCFHQISNASVEISNTHTYTHRHTHIHMHVCILKSCHVWIYVIQPMFLVFGGFGKNENRDKVAWLKWCL